MQISGLGILQRPLGHYTIAISLGGEENKQFSRGRWSSIISYKVVRVIFHVNFMFTPLCVSGPMETRERRTYVPIRRGRRQPGKLMNKTLDGRLVSHDVCFSDPTVSH
jgi:hypothetical protein